ncbi:MAG: amino acid adenylation domain-containing protein [Gammaproteobacteria bacterium]|nr:amino acid adenylation domain-containing protein [Gammaproteobacteria bacterium]
MDNIENIYSLSPLQQGLLFHSISEPDSRVYQPQLSLRIDGRLDVSAFATAWRQMLARHGVLRTAILWEDLDDAYQVVLNAVPLPLTELDWRGRNDQEAALRQLEIAQREQPLDFATPPLMRICLVRLAEQRWQFIWTHHHIVLDGWSEGIVLRDWLACYRALSSGQTPAPAPTRPFQDYIAWLAEQDENAAEAYWRSRLGSISEPTPLPNFAATAPDPNGLAQPELRYAEQSLVLSPAASQHLVEFARAQQVTSNTLIQAAWGWLLGTYAGRQQALFGITLGGRPATLADADERVGLFINTLPLCLEWNPDVAIGDWLRQLQAEVAELRQYEYSALGRLKAFSGIPADRALFDAILVFENFPLDESLSEESLGDAAAELRFSAVEGGIEMGAVRLTQGRNNFPLSLIAIPSGQAFEFALSYSRHRFHDEHIAQMLRHFQIVLNQLTQDGQASIATVHGLAVEERQRLLAWGTGLAVQTPALELHQLFSRHALAHPEQTALVTRHGTLSYQALDVQSNQLARYLQSLGLQAGQFAAIALERDAHFIVALLAILKAGAAYLPLDLKQPPARLNELLTDSAAALVISHSSWRRQLASCPVLRVELDPLQAELATLAPESVVTTTPPAAAYLIYTSGSTGTPKGVVVEHGAIVNYLHSVHALLAPPAASRYAMLSTVAADLGHTQLFGALCLGGTLVLVDEDTSFNPISLADFLAKQQVDILKITPSHLRGLLDALPSPALLPRSILVFGGDTLDGALLQRVRALAPALRVFNHYGPTEAAVGAVATELPAPGPGGVDMGAIPLGKPLPNRRLYVLDAQGRPVPTGVPGELYIGGALARGYLNRPQLNAERFVPDVIAGDGGRLYRTGDRVRWLSNGELAFLGRMDNQVKIRGNRIELGEVEAQVQRLAPVIRQVVARLVQGPDQTPRLLAYVVADGALSTEKLEADIRLRVPEYMVPSAFVLLDEIPLNANGKIDFNRLPVQGDRQGRADQYAAPRNEMERQLAEIWQAVLKVERVGIHDNFFALGGDSILNLQIIARTGQLGYKLTPKQLFEHRTIAALVAALGAGPDTGRSDPRIQTLPLTAGQCARLAAGPLTATWRCVALEQAMDLTVLSHALQAVQQHHRALRMGLSATEDGIWQQTLPSVPKPVSIRRHALPVSDPATLAALAGQCLADLDPAQGETLHACLVDEDQQTLLLLAHPLAVDEASWPLLLRDLNLALDQLHHRRPVALSPTGGEWTAWTQHQQTYARSDALEASWEYWLQYAGLTLSRFHLPAAAEYQHRCLRLGARESQALAQLQRTSRTPWEALLATAIASLLGEELSDTTLLLELQSGRPGLAHLPIEAPIARADFDPSQMVGALAHGAPLFLNWDRNAAPLTQLQRTAGQIAAQPQWGADYALLRYMTDNTWLQEPLTGLPTPQVGLSWLGDWDSHREPAGRLGRVLAASKAAAKAEAFHVSAYWQQDQLCLDCQGAFAAAWSERLRQRLHDWTQLGRQALGAPAPDRFPLCAAQRLDISRLPLDWADIDDLYPLSPTQQGMLLHTRLAPHSGMYLVQERFQWKGPLQRAALEKAWGVLFRRYPILRTGFTWEHSDTPLQYVLREVDAQLDWVDSRALERDARDRQLETFLEAEVRQGFDLGQPPLMRLRVFQMGEQDYLLVRSFHHLLSDAWSYNLVMQDLLAHYQAECHQESVARPLGRPFRDYIGWLMRQDLQAAERFWKEELAGFSEPTPLPIEWAGQQDAVENVADIQINLSIVRTEQLQALCQQHQLTANTWLQGAWGLLLSRYSGKRDLVFGVTVAGRPAELRDVDGIAGVFINSLPLRVKIDDNQPVVSWLTELFARNIALRDYEYTSLADIQRWSEIGANQALFDSLLIYENAPLETTESSDLTDFSIDLQEDRSLTNYPISLMVMPGSRLGLRLSYDCKRFSQETAGRMLRHLSQLLEAMLERPEAALGTLDLLTPPERQQILYDWNRSEADFPLDRTYADLFAQRVEEHPERIAAVCRGASFTYAELDRRANRIAHALIAAGAGPDTLVALFAERGLPLLTMMIAVFKAGAAYLPLDSHHPARRLGELLNQSAAPIVLVSVDATALLESVLTQAAAQPVCLVAEELWLTGAAHRPPRLGTSHDLAYVIFTSGSTGTPKGAMVEQRGMLNNMFGNRLSLDLGAGDRVAQTASQAFDISVWQFLAAPLLGASVHILPDAITMDPAALLHAVEAQGITLMELVPTQIRSLLAAADANISLSSLRWLQSIGEALPPVLVSDWLVRFPHVPLLNAYGPAECSDNIAYHPITKIPADLHRPIPIGGPTANNQLYVLDDALRPVPVGVPGEICASGVSVGRGYWRDPARTAEVFGNHPFAAGERFYRTGDIGRWRDDGIIEYLGRRDFQFKLRGLRIELGEIEARLEALPGVAAAAVVATVTEDGSQHLIAYWSGTEERPDAEFRRLLNEQLPGYMTPSLFVHLDALPQNRNGKVDRKTLSKRPVSFAPRDAQAPRNDTERQLAAVWAELLPTSAFGIDDNFFSLGGNSLLAMQVISRIRAAFRVALPLRALFDHPTVAALAQCIDTVGNQASGIPSYPPPITPQSRDDRLPVSFAQQRLWFLEQLSPASNLFTMPFALTLSGELDVTALQQSFAFLVDRHEILRTTFEAVEGEPWQQIHAATGFDLPMTDLSAQPGDANAIIQQQLNALSGPFDLRRPPLLRAHLFRCAPQRHVLLLALHHIVIDDWSLGLLVDDLMRAYHAFLHGQPPQLAPLDLQYSDFAAWQRQHVSGALRQRQLDYWRQQLAGSPSLLDLPGRLGDEHTGNAPAKPPRGGRHRQLLPSALTQALQAQADASSSSLFMVLHAALSVLLHQQTGRTDLLIGTDIANRHHQETETMLGFFVNQLVLRSRLQPEQRFDEVLAHCRDTTLAAYQHQDLPFDTLVAELLPQRDAGRSPFFQIKLILQNAPQKDLQLHGLRLEEWALDIREAEFELSMNAIPTADGLQLLYNYQPNRYRRHYIEQFSALFDTLLGDIVNASDTTITDLVRRLDQRQRQWQQQHLEQQQLTLESARTVRDQQRASLSTARRKSVILDNSQ